MDAAEIRVEVNSVYNKLVILFTVLFLISAFFSSKIIGSNGSNVKLSFFGFIGVIVLREIMVLALVTVLLVIDCKTIRVFGAIALSFGEMMQAILSVISLIITMIFDIRPNNLVLCIIGILISLFIYFFCICNLISFFLNIQRLLLLWRKSETLELYHEKQVDIASEYNPLVEKYRKMNLEIGLIGDKLGIKYKYKTIFPIDTDDYPRFKGYVGLFDSDDVEILKYAGKVELYVRKVDIQERISSDQIVYLQIIISDKMSLIEECKKTIELSEKPNISDAAKRQILDTACLPFKSLTKMVKLEKKLISVL